MLEADRFTFAIIYRFNFFGEKTMEKTDWREVIERAPRGPISFRDAEYLYCGAVDHVDIAVEFVQIHVKWATRLPLNEIENQHHNWEILNRDPMILVAFLNGEAPYTIEPSPKGDRVRFPELQMLLYFNEDDAAGEVAFTYLESAKSPHH
jgi:hypothetical protein